MTSILSYHVSKRYILILSILLITVWQFSIDIYLTAIPRMVTDLSTTSAAVKFSVIIAIIGFGFSQLVYGPLSDYYGRRHITLIGLVIFIIGTACCAAAISIEWLLIGRFIQGIGIGCAGPVVTAVPKDIFTGKQLKQAFAYISMSIALTPVIAPLLGSYLQTWWGWRTTFVFLLLYSIAVSYFIYRDLPETNATIKQQSLTIAKILQSYFTAVNDRLYMGYLLCIVFLYAGELAYILQMPLVLQHTFGLTPITNGWLVILTALGMGLGAFLSSRLIKYLAAMQIIYLGIMLVALSTILMLICPLLGIYNLYAFLGPMILYMFGSGLTFNNCIAGCMDRFPAQAGLAGALMSGLLMLGSGAFTIIMANMPYSNPYLVPIFMMGCAVGLLAVVFGMIRPKLA